MEGRHGFFCFPFFLSWWRQMGKFIYNLNLNKCQIGIFSLYDAYCRLCCISDSTDGGSVASKTAAPFILRIHHHAMCSCPIPSKIGCLHPKCREINGYAVVGERRHAESWGQAQIGTWIHKKAMDFSKIREIPWPFIAFIVFFQRLYHWFLQRFSIIY